MDKTASRIKGERKVSPIHLIFEGELVLDAPLRDAWPHVINYPSWQNYTAIELLSGDAGQEGAVVRLRKEEEGYHFPPYYALTIRLEPQRRVIWKVWVEKGSEDYDFFGIVRFSVHDAGNGRTRFCYDTLYEFQVPHQDESELTAFRREQQANLAALFAAVLPKLQALVAGKA